MPHKLRSFIKHKHLNMRGLSLNESPGAIKFFSQRPDLIEWLEFSSNPAGNEIIRKNLDKIYIVELSKNHAVIDLLLERIDDVCFYNLCGYNKNCMEIINKFPQKTDWFIIGQNSGAAEYILQNIDKINTTYLSLNKSPLIIDYLKKNRHLIYWKFLCENEMAIDIIREELLKNPESKNIYWCILSQNKCALPLFVNKNINLFRLSLNESCEAIPILKQYYYQLDMETLSQNPNIYEYTNDTPSPTTSRSDLSSLSDESYKFNNNQFLIPYNYLVDFDVSPKQNIIMSVNENYDEEKIEHENVINQTQDNFSVPKFIASRPSKVKIPSNKVTPMSTDVKAVIKQVYHRDKNIEFNNVGGYKNKTNAMQKIFKLFKF